MYFDYNLQSYNISLVIYNIVYCVFKSWYLLYKSTLKNVKHVVIVQEIKNVFMSDFHQHILRIELLDVGHQT